MGVVDAGDHCQSFVIKMLDVELEHANQTSFGVNDQGQESTQRETLQVSEQVGALRKHPHSYGDQVAAALERDSHLFT